MKKIFILILLIFLNFACKKETESKVISFESMFGKELDCQFENVKTKLFYLSPHVIGIPIKEDGFEFEYFHSVGSKKDTNSLYYESSFRSKSNFHSTQSSQSELTRRLRVTIKDEKLYVTAISQLDEKKIPVNPVLYECLVGKNISFKKN